MKFIGGIVLGIALSAGLALLAQTEPPVHPRIAAAIAAIRDARDYIADQPHDFGGQRDAAVKACNDAIRQLNFALEYRPKEKKK